MSGVQFDEGNIPSNNNHVFASSESGMARFLVNVGVADNAKQADKILVIFAFVCIVIAITFPMLNSLTDAEPVNDEHMVTKEIAPGVEVTIYEE
jgi:hypothetical protein